VYVGCENVGSRQRYQIAFDALPIARGDRDPIAACDELMANMTSDTAGTAENEDVIGDQGLIQC
jgi:hypothetical protein